MNTSDNGLLTSPPLARKRSRSPDTAAAASMTSPTRDSTIGVLAALPPPAAPGPTSASSTSAPILSSAGDLTSPPSTGAGAGVPNAGILAALPAPDDAGLILTGGATSQLPAPTAPVSVPVPVAGPGAGPAPTTTKGKKKKNDSSSMIAELQRTEMHRDATTAATAQSVVSVKTSFGVVGTPAPANSTKSANDAAETSTTAAASAPPAPTVHKTVFSTPFAALDGGSSTSSLTTSKPATTANAPNASNTSSSAPSAAAQGAPTSRNSTGASTGAPTSAPAAPVSGDFIVPSAKAPTSATAAAVKAVMHPTMVSAFANGTVGSVVGGTTSAGADAAMHQPPVALSDPAMPLRVSSTSVVKIAQSAVLPGNVPLSFAKMWSEYAALHDEVRAIVAKRKTTTDVPIDAATDADGESPADVKTSGDEDAQVPSSSADDVAASSSSAASCSDLLARIDAFEARAAQTLGGSKATAPPSEEEAAAAKARAENVVDAEVWYRLRARWAVAVASGQLLDEEEGGEPWWVALERWATEKKARKNATA